MLGLVRSAQKFRLLFQHHTTPLQASKHNLFGLSGQNFVSQLGPRLAAIGLDGRTERNWKQIVDPKTWDMIFEKLYSLAPTTQHLIAVFPVPFSFVRIRAAEKVFDVLRKRAPWVRFLPGLKATNSIFGLPELYDDLLDEWTHDAHIKERDAQLVRFQKFAKERSIRVTFLSGDVHCAAFSRFRSDSLMRERHNLTPESDTKLMYQVISSAIVNQAPSANVCIAYHYLKTKWNPVPETEEQLVEMFERRPEKGKHVRHRKIMPNRNWCYFEEVGGKGSKINPPPTGTPTINGQEDGRSSSGEFDREIHEHDHEHLRWARSHYCFDRKKGYPSTLGPTSNPDGTGIAGDPMHEHRHGLFCHHRKSKWMHRGHDHNRSENEMKPELQDRSGLRLRIWLESRRKEEEGRQFASYEVVVPDLTRDVKRESRF
jgi:PhoD related phosphatase